MDSNRVEGTAQDLGGKLKDAVGGLTGDTKLQAEGKADQGLGKAKNAAGQVLDFVKNRPFVSAGIAAVTAYVLGRRGK